jgi:heme/copper-type cytochrome/quinol oxidase subunit 2
MNHEMLQLACATCAKSFQEGGGDAAGWSILFLLAVIVPVLGATGICMVRIVRRERAALDPKYMDQ